MSGNLSDEQRRIQQAAAFDLPRESPGNYTHEQIEGMRRFVQSYDAQNAAIRQEFDLNKPPTPPYRYQEYPRMLYRGAQTTIVHDDDELEIMLAQDWSKTPPLPGTVEINLGGQLTPAMQAEVQRIDTQARTKR